MQIKKATIYHNPRCSKSRNTLAILKENGVQVTEIKYLETTPSKEKLVELCKMLNMNSVELVRSGESLFKELGLSIQDNKTDNEWLEILVNNPKLIERPIVQLGDKAIIGRPPENVLKLL